MSAQWERREPSRAPTARYVDEHMQRLSEESLEFFSIAYEIDPIATNGAIRECPATSRYALRITGPMGQERGWVLRQPWAGAPLLGDVRECWRPKADTYKYLPAQPLLAHFGLSLNKGPLVVVEDQLSALKLAAYGYASVACLGVPDMEGSGYSGSDRVREISRRAGDRDVLIALDADATETAFKFVKKWRYAFRGIRVVMLTQDLKDTPASKFAEVLGA